MTPLTIYPVWLILMAVAATACISLITLSIGLYILSGRKEKRRTPPLKNENASSKTSKIPDIMGTTRQPERQ